MGRGEKRIYGEERVKHRENRKITGEGELREEELRERKEDTEGRKMGKDKRIKI